jgi:protease-4
MRQFFKFVLASMVGFVLTMILGFFFILIMAGMAASNFGESEYALKSNSVLELNLGLNITDRTTPNPVLNYLNDQYGGETVGLDRLIKAIKAAKNADEIEGIYLNTAYAGGNYATLEEIRNALLDFKESGKFIYAYSEFFYEPSYYLASVADSVFMNPSGTFIFNGLSSQTAFMKDMLTNLGIDMQVFKVGKFKGATETFSQTEMSPENRLQIQEFVNSIYEHYIENVSKERGVSTAALRSISDELKIKTPISSVDHKLVDQLLYEDQVKEVMRNRMGLSEGTKPILVGVNNFLRSGKGKSKYVKEKIAVIYAIGEIGSGEGDEENIGSKTLTKALVDARENDNVKAVVLRVNSPGGSALASDIICREAQLCAAKKPLIVSMGDLAASGGYYICTAADTIVAQPNSITGSIGVFMILPNMKQLLNEKIGIHYESVNSNKYSDIGRIDKPLSEDEQAYFQALVDNIYEDFIVRVAEGRDMSKEIVDSIGQGRVWTAESALEIGLVDVLGGLEDAIQIAADKAGMDNYGIIQLPRVKNPFEKLFGGMNMESRILSERLGKHYEHFRMLEKLEKLEGVQMLMPYSLNIQ